MNHAPALPRPRHHNRVALGLEGPGPLPPRSHPHRPRAEDSVRGAQAGRLHDAERGRGQPLRESVCVQLGGSVLHDGLDPHLLGRLHALAHRSGASKLFVTNTTVTRNYHVTKIYQKQ